MTPTEWIIKMHNQAEKLEDFFNQTIDAETRLFALGKAFGIRQAIDRKSTRLNSSHITRSRMPSSA